MPVAVDRLAAGDSATGRRLSEAERSKRARAAHALRVEIAPALVKTGRLRPVDRDNREAINAACGVLLADWARCVTSDGKGLVRRGGLPDIR
jgi:hypothetical protein